MRADGLHKEAAFLSNTLHEFADSDVAGRKPVVDQILSIRSEWKKCMKAIEYFEKTGMLPATPLETSAVAGKSGVVTPGNTNAPGVADLKVELSRINVNISKYQKKIDDKPDHKKAEQWAEDLAKMKAMKQEINQSIVALTYETA